MRGRFPRLRLLWAGGGFAGKLVGWTQQFSGWVLESIRRSDAQQGFKLLPKRWIVECTFTWFGQYRRLSKDAGYLPQSSEAMIRLAMIGLMLRRLEP